MTMRRTGNLWPQVVHFGALRRAARRAARGKRATSSAARFLDRLEPELLRLQRDLIAGTWRPGTAQRFVIHDPKERTITAVPFADRVVHHALIAPLEPLFERRMISDSFACRKGLGTHAALRRATQLLRRHDWFLKLDVRRCFDSISHRVVHERLARIVKDRRVLELCARILGGPTGDPALECALDGRGLPIGSLTSQWFCNLVLDPLDHHIREVLRVPGYVRYMDDMLLFHRSIDDLQAAHGDVRAFLAERLDLALKDSATVLAPARVGAPFLGWRIHRGGLRLRRETLRRAEWRLRLRQRALHRGWIDAESCRQSTASIMAHLSHGGTLALRRRRFVDSSIEPPNRACVHR